LKKIPPGPLREMKTEVSDSVEQQWELAAHVNGPEDATHERRSSLRGRLSHLSVVGSDELPEPVVDVPKNPFSAAGIIPKSDGRFYGSARLNKGMTCWALDLEPHVSTMAKRLFARLEPASSGRNLILSASEENCEDLRWFISRYPLKVEACVGVDDNRQRIFDELIAWKILFERSEGYRARGVAARMIELGQFRLSPDVDHRMALPPRPYQQRAAAMLLTMGGLLLADMVGLGKTASALTALADRRCLPALVVCPPHLMTHWEDEVRRFLPSCTVHAITRTKPYRLFGVWPDVLICSYHRLKGWVDALDGKIKAIVYDEVHQLRHDSSQIYKACAAVAKTTVYRLGMSATPIAGYGEEFFNVLNALRPGMLGTREEFKREWCNQSIGPRKATIREPEAFGRYVKDVGVMMRRTRADVSRELPALNSIAYEVEHDAAVLKAKEKEILEYAKILAGTRRAESTRNQRRDAGGAMDRLLRQASGLAKAPYVADFVRMLIEQEERPVLLFGWHRQVYELWGKRLADLNPVWYTGSETAAKKDAAKRAFLTGETKLMIMSLRSGVGLHGLQSVCSTVVLGELDWSPAIHEQGIGRVHRDGQESPVFAYYAVAREGVDPFMIDVLGVKRAQLSGVVDPDRPIVEQTMVDPDHIQKLASAYLQKRGQQVCV